MSARFINTRFVTGVLAIGALIATLSTATPAAAGDHDKLKKFIGAAATIYLLHELSKQDRKKPKANVHQPQNNNRHDAHNNGRRNNNGHNGHNRRSVVPRACLRDTQAGLVLGARCLNNNYTGSRALPGNCRTRVWFKGKERRVYKLRCLRKNGFALSRA